MQTRTDGGRESEGEGWERPHGGAFQRPEWRFGRVAATLGGGAPMSAGAAAGADAAEVRGATRGG
jgi:hypothetical protein